MIVTCRLFARYAEVLGIEEVSLDLPPNALVADAIRELRETLESGELLPERPMVALNLEHVLPARPLVHGDVLAILPPLAGG